MQTISTSMHIKTVEHFIIGIESIYSSYDISEIDRAEYLHPLQGFRYYNYTFSMRDASEKNLKLNMETNCMTIARRWPARISTKEHSKLRTTLLN